MNDLIEMGLALMMLITSMLVLVPLVATVVCYFLSRAEEKRSGEVLFTGKSAVIFTLMNNAGLLFFVAWTMICFNIIGDMENSYNNETDEYEKGWEVLRMGLALLVTSGLSLLVLSVLWRNWTGSNELLPRDNIFVKCFSGINMFVLSGLVISLATSILFLLLEAMASDNVKIDEMGDVFKLPVVTLICTIVFLAINIRLFGGCSDRAPSK
jgi:hypothetical protein